MTTIPVHLQITATAPGGGQAIQVVSIPVPVPDSLVREVTGRPPDLSAVSSAELSAELARRLNAPIPGIDDIDEDDVVDEGPREPELRYPQPEPEQDSAEPVAYRCQHGAHTVEPVLYAGVLPTCACCGAAQGVLSPERPAPAPPPGWCSFCADRWWTTSSPAPRPDPSDPLPF